MKDPVFHHLFSWIGRPKPLVFAVRASTALQFGPFFSTARIIEDANLSEDASEDNAFREYAQSKLNLSASEVSKIIKAVPRLARIESLETIECFVNFWKQCGCEETDIGTIIMRHPYLLKAKTNDLIEKKVQVLKDFGIVGRNLVKVLTFRPRILSASLERVLCPRMEFLGSVYHSKSLLAKALVKTPSLLLHDLDKTLKPCVRSLENAGVRGKGLAALLLAQPGLLLRSSITPDKARFIQGLGLAMESKMYRHALAVVAGSKMETLDEKFQNLVALGLSPQEASAIFRSSPYIFVLSKEKVRRNMEFVVNTMRLPANAVAKSPCLLSLNLEKRIRPRFLVFQKVNSLGWEKKLSFSSILAMTEKKFLKDFVNMHSQSAVLTAIYTTALQDGLNASTFSTKTFLF